MMTVERLARELNLWEEILQTIDTLAENDAPRLICELARLPVKRSSATRRMGSYVSLNGRAVCIRLQFSQEPDNLKQTLLHEIAHFCDHQLFQSGKKYRRAHGAQWQTWAIAFGVPAKSCGNSEALNQLHQQRLKLVAVCQNCGAEFRRVRRLNRRRKYFHTGCGGFLRQI